MKIRPIAVIVLALLSLFAHLVFAAPPTDSTDVVGMPVVVAKGAWTVTSEQINHLTAIATGPEGTTWLGTPLGVKRVTPQGTRFYTALDGLPPGPVVALATASTPGNDTTIWCAVLAGTPPPGVPNFDHSLVTVCRYDQTKDHWIPLPSVHLPFARRVHLAADSMGDVFLAEGAYDPFQGSVDDGRKNPYPAFFRLPAKARRWESIAWPDRIDNISYGYLNSQVTFLQATSNGLAVGATTGLLLWKPKNSWTALLERPVYAGIQGQAGDWWLATEPLRRQSDIAPLLVHREKDGSLSQSIPLPVLPGTAKPAPIRRDAASIDRLHDLMLVASSSGLWAICAISPEYLIYIQPNYSAIWLVRFDPSHNTTTLLPETEAGDAPTAVLAPLLTHISPDLQQGSAFSPNSPLPALLRKRFASCFTPPSNEPLPPSTYKSPPYHGQAGTDPDGSTWDHAPDNTLVRITPDGTQEKFPLPPVRFPVYGDTAGVAMTADGSLFIATPDSILRRSPTGDAWQALEPPLPAPGAWLRYGYATRLIAQSTGLWLATDAFAAHYDTHSGKFAPAITNDGRTQYLLGVRADGNAWLNRGEQGIVLASPDGKILRQFVPAASDTSGVSLAPFREVSGVLGDTVWYVGQTSHPDGTFGTVLTGYDSRHERWTPPLSCAAALSLRSEATGDPPRETLWVLAVVPASRPGEQETRVFRWTTDSDSWKAIGPPLPKSAHFAGNVLRIIDAQPDNIWITDRDRIVLYHWDDHARDWQTLTAPPGAGISAGNTVADAGASTNNGLTALYIAGITGLWQYTVHTGKWQHVAFPTFGNWWLFKVANGGPAAAWVVLFHPATNTFAGARFDKKHKTWTVYGQSEGFPTRDAQDYSLTPDPVHPDTACWLLTRRRLYRLDTTGHWRDRTREITTDNPVIAPIKLIPLPSGDAWIVNGAASVGSAPSKAAAQVAYWNRKADSFTRYTPAPPNAFGTDLLPEPDGSAVLATTQGAFHFDPHTQRWNRLDIPGFPTLPVAAVARDPAGLWLIGYGIAALCRGSAPTKRNYNSINYVEVKQIAVQ